MFNNNCSDLLDLIENIVHCLRLHDKNFVKLPKEINLHTQLGAAARTPLPARGQISCNLRKFMENPGMRNTWVPDAEAFLPRLISKRSGSHHLSNKLQTSVTQHLPPPVRVTSTVPWGSPLGFCHLLGTGLWLKVVQDPLGPKEGVNCTGAANL